MSVLKLSLLINRKEFSMDPLVPIDTIDAMDTVDALGHKGYL